MTKFLVALDSSEHANRAFSCALSLRKSDADTLVLLTVVKEKKGDAGTATLAPYAARCEQANVAHTLVVHEGGDPREIICKYVDDNAVDMLVVGPRGLSTLKQLFIGSVSNYCVHHASCDVVIAK